MKIRFLKHKVVNDDTKQSARVHYSLDNRTDGRKCVTIYAKDYGHQLSKVFASNEVENHTDTMTDYFDKDKVVLFEDHILYKDARKRANENNGIFEEKPKLYMPENLITVSKEDIKVSTVYVGLMKRLGVKNFV
jgi:hypothetical protein